MIAIRRQQKGAEAWYAIGVAALRSEKLDHARDAFGRAVAEDPTHANSLYRLGEIAQDDGDVSTAINFLERALSANPAHVSASERLKALRRSSHRHELQATKPRRPADKREPTVNPPSPTLARQPSRGSVFGIVRTISQQTDQHLLTKAPVRVISLRLQRKDQPGALLPPLSVTMRGQVISGEVQLGDLVQLPKGWRPGREPKFVVNLSADVLLDTRTPLSFGVIFTYAVVAFIALWLLFLFSLVVPALRRGF